MNIFKYLGTEAAAFFLKRGAVRFAQPSAYNDPFELMIDFRIKAQLDIAEHPFNTRLDLLGGESVLPKHEIKPEDIPLYGFHMDADFLNKVRSSIFTTCFSRSAHKIPANLLLWAHYAESHRGLAIQLKSDSAHANLARPVQYRKTRPIVDGAMLKLCDVIPITDFYVKSDHWSYEKEYRIAKSASDFSDPHATDTAKYPVYASELPPQEIERVVLGVNANHDLRKLAIEYHQRTGVQVVFLRASDAGFGFRTLSVLGGDFEVEYLYDTIDAESIDT